MSLQRSFLSVLALPLLAGPAVAVAAEAPPAVASAAMVPAMTLLGPPAICHPIDIGEARSLPWGNGGWIETDDDYDVARVVDDTLSILGGSDNALVHMETIRRATLYLSGMGKLFKPKSESWRNHEGKRLHTALEQVAQRLDAGRGKGLALFDVGYLLAAFDQAGLWSGVTEPSWFDKAVAQRPDDGALHLGAALASFGQHTPNAVTWRHLDKAVTLAEDRAGLLHGNLVSTMSHFLDVHTYDELAARVRRESKLG